MARLGGSPSLPPNCKPRLTDTLIKALSDPDDMTRATAAENLGRIKAKAAVTRLYETREDRSGRVAVWSAWAIWNTTGAREQAVAVLTSRLTGDGYVGKWEAIYLLAEFDSPTQDTIDALVALSKYDGKAPFSGNKYEQHRLKTQAITTLKKIAPKALAP